MQLARLAAKRAVQDEMRAQGVRVTLVFPAELMRQAREYLDTHPELYQLALERAKRMGYIDPRQASQYQLLLLCKSQVRNDRHRAGNSMAARAAISRAS